MKLKGVLKLVFDAVKHESGFVRRSFVLEHERQGYTDNIIFELHNDHCVLVEKFKEGDGLIIDFNIRGRKWVDGEGHTKYFNVLQAWKLSPWMPGDEDD